MDTNVTQGDAAGMKPEPKVSTEKAREVVGPKVTALLNEVVAGFELAADDKKSRKRILKAFAEAAAKAFDGQAGLKPSSISRQFSYGLSNAFPPPPMEASYAPEGEGGEEDSDGDGGIY